MVAGDDAFFSAFGVTSGDIFLKKVPYLGNDLVETNTIATSVARAMILSPGLAASINWMVVESPTEVFPYALQTAEKAWSVKAYITVPWNKNNNSNPPEVKYSITKVWKRSFLLENETS
ncbi:hypothetical protein JOC86_003907 [Bacillus pakistanensis]|uniref:Uncharacterized protein n=1 Tax=Rossellomorea pakistanensis TaxID=992288 RepID=A0ABS2NHJ3_9BACI|nr:hypothetical protein [Bacillus pakistanensis]